MLLSLDSLLAEYLGLLKHRALQIHMTYIDGCSQH